MPTPGATDLLTGQLPRRVVPRPDLQQRLDEVAPGGLALIVASAGSGKSVLVRQWIAARSDLRVAALTRSRRHEDPTTLARDLVAALRSVAPQLDATIGERLAQDESRLG